MKTAIICLLLVLTFSTPTVIIKSDIVPEITIIQPGHTLSTSVYHTTNHLNYLGFG